MMYWPQRAGEDIFTIYLHKAPHRATELWYNPRMDKTRRIAVAAERSSAYGRSFIRGVAEVAEQHPEWNLMLVDPQHIAPLADCKFDGWICRVADGRTAKALVQCKVPVVDCLCAVSEPRFAAVKTDAVVTIPALSAWNCGWLEI